MAFGDLDGKIEALGVTVVSPLTPPDELGVATACSD